MFCNNSGAEIPNGANFCTSCGSSIPGANPQPAPNPQPTPVVVQIQQPVRPVDTRKGPGPGIAAFIIGILSLCISWIPVIGFFLPLISLILGMVGASKKRRKRGFGIWGIVFSLASILICALITFGIVGAAINL